jgi:hypothetical protein
MLSQRVREEKEQNAMQIGAILSCASSLRKSMTASRSARTSHDNAH